MNTEKYERFRQRYQNFQKAVDLLEKQCQRKDLEDENIAATLHFYEVAFEISWKLLKDNLEIHGLPVKSPREAIKTAFSMEHIDDGALWIEMLDARNSISHMYKEDMARELFVNIKDKYLNALIKLCSTLGEVECVD